MLSQQAARSNGLRHQSCYFTYSTAIGCMSRYARRSRRRITGTNASPPANSNAIVLGSGTTAKA